MLVLLSYRVLVFSYPSYCILACVIDCLIVLPSRLIMFSSSRRLLILSSCLFVLLSSCVVALLYYCLVVFSLSQSVCRHVELLFLAILACCRLVVLS